MAGTVLLVRYVQGAEARATAGEELVEVYVVKDVIPAGTIGGESLADFVEVETVPVKVQAAGAVRSLASLENKVTAVESGCRRTAGFPAIRDPVRLHLP